MTKTRRARFSKRGGGLFDRWFGSTEPSYTGWGAGERPSCNGHNVSICTGRLQLGGGRKTVKRRAGRRRTGVKRKGSRKTVKRRGRRRRGGKFDPIGLVRKVWSGTNWT